jgi:hypothetical protein
VCQLANLLDFIVSASSGNSYEMANQLLNNPGIMSTWGTANAAFTNTQNANSGGAKRGTFSIAAYEALRNEFKDKFDQYIRTPMLGLILGDDAIVYSDDHMTFYMVRDGLAANLTINGVTTPDSLDEETGVTGIGIVVTLWASDSFPGNATRLSKVLSVSYFDSEDELDINDLVNPIELEFTANATSEKYALVCIWYDADEGDWKSSVSIPGLKTCSRLGM